MTHIESVATSVVRLTRPLVDQWPRPSLLTPIVTAAVLLDLALDGRLVSGPDGLELDTDPTGSAPADKLLAAVTDDGSRPLVWWLYHSPIGVADVADELVRAGAWKRHGVRRDYVEVDPAAAAAELAAVRDALDGSAEDPRASAVGALMQLLPRFGEEGGEAAVRLARQCGSASWLAAELIDELARRRERLANVSRQTSFTDVISNIPF